MSNKSNNFAVFRILRQSVHHLGVLAILIFMKFSEERYLLLFLHPVALQLQAGSKWYLFMHKIAHIRSLRDEGTSADC